MLYPDKYELMRQSEAMEDDGPDLDELTGRAESDVESFKRGYKDFYTDIKLDIKEDW